MPVCSECKQDIPRSMVTKTPKQNLVGGWTCPNCGAEFDWMGKTVEFIKVYGILSAPKRKERTAMLRYASERDKPNQILNLTSLTVEQFEQLFEPFEQAFVRHMREWTMERKPRTARAYTPY